MKGRIYMSNKELSRVEILQKVSEKKLKLAKAAKLLRVSVRQAKRLKKKFKSDGASGLVSRKVGNPSNNQVSEEHKKLVLAFFDHEDHWDFRPTLAHEYLVQDRGLTISISSVRSIMIRHGFWHANEVRNYSL